jgi:hypothetical protein
MSDVGHPANVNTSNLYPAFANPMLNPGDQFPALESPTSTMTFDEEVSPSTHGTGSLVSLVFSQAWQAPRVPSPERFALDVKAVRAGEYDAGAFELLTDEATEGSTGAYFFGLDAAAQADDIPMQRDASIPNANSLRSTDTS